jgi:RNA polymerase-binding transcription factor DksA
VTIAHRSALTRALRAVDGRLRELGDPIPADLHGDTADLLAAREDNEYQVLGRAGLVERKRLILAALDKVGTELEGKCDDCGQVIPGKRLAAIPWAQRDLLCEARVEEAAARNAPPPPADIPAPNGEEQ